MQRNRTWTNLEDHLAQEHKRSPFQDYLKEIVYGGNDGIVTTFAVVAGFAGAGGGESPLVMGTGAVLLFGLANLFADAASMGLGNYLSIRSQQDYFNKEYTKELAELQNNKEFEIAESVAILTKKGFSKADAQEITRIYSKNHAYWAEFMMKDELELPDPRKDKPMYNGLATAISFISFGSIPLWPYIVLGNENVFTISIVSTFIALLLLGILRWKVTQQSPVRSITEVLLIGGLSSSIAFLVGTIFK